MRSQRKRSESGISTEFYTARYIFHHHKSRLLLVVGQNAVCGTFALALLFRPGCSIYPVCINCETANECGEDSVAQTCAIQKVCMH